MKYIGYLIVIIPFAFVTYKMRVAPDKLTNSDFIVSAACIIIATIVSLRSQFLKRKEIQGRLKSKLDGK
jgi:hypothetical protein